MKKTIDQVNKAIEQWQREIPELASDNMLLIGRLANCSLRILHHLESLYNQFGINGGEFDVLASLRRSGAPYQLAPTALFSTLMVTSGTMTNRLQRLENKGLISRLPNPEDARSLLVVLSESGLVLINELIFAHVEAEKSLYALISPEQKKQLETGLGDWLAQLPPLPKCK